MTEHDCRNSLLGNLPFEEKARALLQYLQQAERELFFFRPQTAHRWALRDLEVATPPESADALRRTIHEFNSLRKAQLQQEAHRIANYLRTLTPGTPIVIRSNGQEETVILTIVQRTRFLATRSGGYVNVPAHLFVRLATPLANTPEVTHVH